MSSGLADAVGGLALGEQLAKFKHARVRGLTGRVALNDNEVELMGFHEPSSRWMVRVVLTGEEVRIKPANLEASLRSSTTRRSSGRWRMAPASGLP